MIKILRALSCLSYTDFLHILEREDNYYTQGKFNDMKQNLAVFLCELDEQTASKFIEFGANKSGVEQ